MEGVIGARHRVTIAANVTGFKVRSVLGTQRCNVKRVRSCRGSRIVVIVAVVTSKGRTVPRIGLFRTPVVTVRGCTRTRNIVTRRYAVAHVVKVDRRTVVVRCCVIKVTLRRVVTVTLVTGRLVTKISAMNIVSTACSSWPLTASVARTTSNRDRVAYDGCVNCPTRINKVMDTVAPIIRVTSVTSVLSRVVRTNAVYLDDRVAVFGSTTPRCAGESKVVVAGRGL